MAKKKFRGKTLAELEEDHQKALRDLGRLQQQLEMVRGVITYLAQEIRKLRQEESE